MIKVNKFILCALLGASCIQPALAWPASLSTLAAALNTLFIRPTSVIYTLIVDQVRSAAQELDFVGDNERYALDGYQETAAPAPAGEQEINAPHQPQIILAHRISGTATPTPQMRES